MAAASGEEVKPQAAISKDEPTTKTASDELSSKVEAISLQDGKNVDDVEGKDSKEDTGEDDEENSDEEEENEEEEIDRDEFGVMQMESLCMNCHGNGVTKLLLLKVPYFRDIMLESFDCSHCNHKNNSVKSALQIQPQGTKYTLVLDEMKDLDRQVIKSDSAIFTLDTLGIEMPKDQGQLTNVEGVLAKILTALESEQPARKKIDPDLHKALDDIIQKLIKMMNGCSFPFTITLDDPSGNSWIAPAPHNEGTKYKRNDYTRTHEQNEALGIAAQEKEGEEQPEGSDEKPDTGGLEGVNIIDGEVYQLPSECPACMMVCTVNMQKINVPHFKEVFVWSTSCDHCGHRTSDVKTGGEVPEKGRRIKAKVETMEDLSRDVLKSDTCTMHSEDLELSVQPGTLGGRFTTIEGLLTEIRNQLHGQIFDADNLDFMPTDSMPQDYKSKWVRFFDRLDNAIKGDMKFEFIMEDPLANSYVQDLYSPEADPRLVVEDYTRSYQEEDELGLNDMKTEGYEEEHKAFLERERAKEREEASEDASAAAQTSEKPT